MANKSKKSKAAPKKAASKKPAAKKATPKPAAKSKAGGRGKRYTPQQKAKILAYVAQVNAQKGRGGAAAASRKFGVNQISIGQWIKKAGASATSAPAAKSTAKPAAKRRGRPAGKKTTAKASGNFSANLRRLANVHDAISQKEAELASLQKEYAALKAAL